MKETQPKGMFCQSCAMPMVKPDDFGTNADRSKSKEYCHYCYQNGTFTDPHMSMQQMIEKCEGIMKQMHVPEAQIKQTKAFIPLLKRWKK